MDEDRIDPARTEATIQRSLDKAKDRRVGAADIVMRMKATACLPNTGCMSLRMCVCDVMEDAVEEIERLRGENNLLNKEVGAATALLNNATSEMASARVEIKEMNRRIDMLRGRKS